MRKLILPNKKETIISKELQQLINNARQFELSLADEHGLIIEIRNGNHLTIERLIKASSLMIYKAIARHPSNKHSISQQFRFAQSQLYKLALSELNAKTRERYLRFQAFYIRQALLEFEM